MAMGESFYDSQGPADKLPQRFPGMRPVGSVPPLFKINGCGTGLFGRRDVDPETRAYVATYCISLLFIPVVPLRAYRVADAPEGGWYFLGRESLSGFAKIWNLALLSAILVLGTTAAWNSYTSSPEYRMAGKLREAGAQEAAGRASEAFRGYAAVADSGTASTDAARKALEGLFTEKLPKLPAEQAGELLRLGAERAGLGRPEPSKKSVLSAAWTLADRCLAEEPKRSLAVLDAVRGLAGDSQEHAARRASVVRSAAARHPDDPDLASELAVVLEAAGDLPGCEKVLAPVAARLGASEGARILGGLYSSAGKFNEARGLLMAYCDGRLKQLHATTKELEKLQESVGNGTVSQLRSGAAGDAWYRTYDSKDKAGKQAMVDEYVGKALRNDGRFKKLNDRLVEQAAIVPVALDLGMVMLRRAQGMSGEERRKELLAAEQVFISVRGVAAQSDTYRVFYGQVLYWLGRAEEGRKLFDEYLASKQRSFESLSLVAGLLREVGATSESWAMAEEAYANEKDVAKKQAMAGFLAACARDVDTVIVWLERSNPNDKETQAHLASSKGNLAERDGKDREAEAHYRQSVAIYAELPKKNSTVLNNAALVYTSLFRVSGKAEDYRRAAAMLEEAVGMTPDQSILVGNTADLLDGRAVLDLTEGRLDYKALGMSPDPDLLSFLYDDAAGRDEVVRRYTESLTFRKAVDLRKRAMLLAPRNRRGASSLLALLGWSRDEAALLELKGRLGEVALDLETYRKETLEGFAGKKDAERRKAMELAITRFGKAAAQPSAGKDDLTPAVAGVQLLGVEIGAFTNWGRPLQADEAVARAEKLAAEHPSLMTRWSVVSALFSRVSRRLAAAHPGYAAAAEKTKRALGPDYSLILAAEGDPQLRAAAAADPDLKRILALEQENFRRLPKRVGIWQWALRRQFAPETAKDAADRILADRAGQLRVELDYQVKPMSATDTLNFYWLLQLRGEEPRARELLRTADKDGVPLPWTGLKSEN